MRNKRVIFLFMFISFVILGSSMIFAIEGPSYGSSEDSEEDSSISDETRREIIEEKLEQKNDRLRESLKKEFREDGKIVKIERKVEVKDDGSVEITIKKTIIDANGVEKKIVMRIVEKNGERKIKIEGEEDVPELETELEIEDDFEGNHSDLETTTSDGEKHKVRVLPDEARRKILERLKANNISAIELREIEDRNVPRVVYNIETNKHGRFLGIFKLKMKIDGQIDPETGDVLSINKPWWAILVAGEDDAEEGFSVNETEDMTGTFLENTTSNESDIAA